MLPHPDTVCVLKDLDRRALLAEVAQERLARQAVARDRRPGVAATVRAAIGTRLVRLGLLIQGMPAPSTTTAR